MKKEYRLYLLIGIGLGILCSTSLFSASIIMNVDDFYDSINITDENIETGARELGMVYPEEVEPIPTNNDSEQVESKENDINTINDMSMQNNLSQNQVTYIEFRIPEEEPIDDIALMLQDLGLVKDALNYCKYVESRGLSRRIIAGNYVVHSNITEEELTDLITY